MKIHTLRTICPRVKYFSPHDFMDSFGINYLRYERTSMAETIIYYGCTNIPEYPYQLPDFIKVIETMETKDIEIKSVELTARPKNMAALVTYNKSKEIIAIEHGVHSEMMEKFDLIMKQLIKEKQ